MNAVVMRSPGDPGALHTTRVPILRPSQGQVLVRVHAATVDRRDLSIRSDAVPIGLPLVPGSDAAGEVVLVGPGVTECSPGDRVVVVSNSMGRTGMGGCAEYVTVAAFDVHPIPDNVSFVSSASVGRGFSAAWAALFQAGRLGHNERVAVIGAAHLTGIAAVQICRGKGSKVIAVSDGRHAQRLTALGATRVISQSAPNLADHVKAGFDGQGATVAINVVGTALAASVEMLDRHGRLILTNGGDPQPLDVRRLVEQTAQVIGATNQIDALDVHHVLKLLSEATLVPVIDSIFPLSEAAEAHWRAESELTFGAVLLVPDHLYRSGDKLTELLEED